MKSNITLIGMPGAGKSTVGVVLAKFLSFGFIDTDTLIQINHQKKLQDIINEQGLSAFRDIEESEILKLNVTDHVVATGGSVVYSEEAMSHLKETSLIAYLNVSLEELKERVDNYETRGIAKREGQDFLDLFKERQALYNKYADLTIECNGTHQEKVALQILSRWYNLKEKQA